MHFGMGGEWDEYITTTLEMEYKKKKKKKIEAATKVKEFLWKSSL